MGTGAFTTGGKGGTVTTADVEAGRFAPIIVASPVVVVPSTSIDEGRCVVFAVRYG